jgi:two-component system, OmpR family, phosphate regulon sensor histidine kinase PhoR
LRGSKRFVGVATAVATTAVGIAALTEWFHPNDAAGQPNRLTALRLVADGLALAAVFGLCWMARRRDEVPSPAATPSAPSSGAEDRVRQLEAQVRDLELQCRLAVRRQRQIEAIICSLRDAVLVIDESDRLLVANEAAAKLLGFDPQTAKQKPLAQLMGAAHQEFVDLLQGSRHRGLEANRREMTFADADGPHTFDTIVSCVQEGGKVCGAAAVLHDITREKEVSQMKNDFVSHVSHELKTPLASIMAYSEMLADGEANDEQTQKEFYGVIQTQAQRLNRLIEDILNISRIESGLIKVHKEPVSLTILIEQQMPMIAGFAQEKNITVTRPEPIVFDQVLADKDMISQVIVNLLSNAVKYTPAGGRVRIAAEVDSAEHVARVTVSDTGAGIPPEEIGHLFEKFYRVSANNKLAKGTGLGLNLVKQIVEKIHNGRVFVTSQVGVGSTFGFELPLATPALVETA